MIYVGLHSVGTCHKKFGWKKKKIQNIICRVSKNGTRQSVLCRVPTLDARQKLTTVSYRRLLTALCRTPPSPSVWDSAKISLLSLILCREFCSRQTRSLPRARLCRVRHSAKRRALGKATDSGSVFLVLQINIYLLHGTQTR
jgi:hypothetical protein